MNQEINLWKVSNYIYGEAYFKFTWAVIGATDRSHRRQF